MQGGKPMKKLLALALALCMVLSAVPALALDLLPAGDTYPLNSDKVITWYNQNNINPHEKFASADESPFHTGLEKIFGVDIEWIFPTTGSNDSAYTQVLLADPTDLPDIMGGYFSANASQYIDDEIIWDLTPYIAEYAPAWQVLFLRLLPGGRRLERQLPGPRGAHGLAGRMRPQCSQDHCRI